MADLFLKRRFLGDRDYLPPICIVCGEPEAESKKVTLYYQPYFWLEFFSRVSVVRWQATWVPLCPDHWSYFGRLNLYGLSGLIGGGLIVALMIGIIFTAVKVPQYRGAVVFGGMLTFFCTVVVLLVVRGLIRLRQVRPTRIDDSGVHLVNVAPELVEELAERRGRPAPSRDELGSGGGGMALYLVLGGAALVLFLACGFAGLLMTLGLSRRAPVPNPAATVESRPINPTWDESKMTRIHLSDLAEQGVRVGYGEFGKNGMLGYGVRGEKSSAITVDGRPYPKAISMAPPNYSHSTVQYSLGGQGKIFRAWAAVNDVDDDHRKGPETPLQFVVLGDSRRLWVSSPVTEARVTQECRVNVEGVNLLELQVQCPGPMHSARAVWLEPQVLK